MPPLAKAGQNWNNVLSYIKLSLGAPLNLIEMSDDEIIENLKEHVLSVFSQYCPLKKWLYIGPEHAVNTSGLPGQPQYVFKIPKPDDESIVDILEVLFGPYSVKNRHTIKTKTIKKIVYLTFLHRNIYFICKN